MVYKSNYQKFLTNVNDNINLFSKAERKLALFFRKNNDQLLNLNAGDIAQKANVSKATVSRFIRKLGYTDFTEFRYLLQEKSKMSIDNRKNTDLASTDLEFISYIKDEYNFLMKRTINHIDEQALTYFIEHIKQAHNIYIAGLGSSRFPAKEMTRKFIQLGFAFKTLDEISMVLNYTLIMKAEDFFIVFSRKGESKYLLQAMKLARSKNVQIVLITNCAQSALTTYADCVFLTTYEMSMVHNTIISPRLSQLFLIDILFNAVARSDMEKYTEIIQTMAESQPKYHEQYLVQQIEKAQ